VERAWEGETCLGALLRVRTSIHAVCPVDPNVNHIWITNGSGTDRLSV
jgi:hypothetical protein